MQQDEDKFSDVKRLSSNFHWSVAFLLTAKGMRNDFLQTKVSEIPLTHPLITKPLNNLGWENSARQTVFTIAKSNISKQRNSKFFEYI